MSFLTTPHTKTNGK